MTIYQTIKILTEIAKNQPNVNTVGEGDIYEFMNAQASIKYNIFFVSQGEHREDDNFDYYTLTLFNIDRLEEDGKNKLQIQSSAKETLSNIIRTMLSSFYDVDAPEVRYQPFTQRFVDYCAGVYATVTFRVDKEWTCPEEYEIKVIKK